MQETKTNLVKGDKKSEEQNKALPDINRLFNLKEHVTKLFDGYTSIISEARYKAVKKMKLKDYHPNKCFKDYQQHLRK